MTVWTFDLRSNGSDTEDEENMDPSHNTTSSDTHTQQDDTQSTRQKQTNNELEELFGPVEDEESVHYKPNPWSIAKINANARVAGPPSSKPKKTWKSTCNTDSRSSGLRRFWNDPKGLPCGGNRALRTNGEQPTNNGNKSLRESISEALRRGGPVAIISPKQDHQSRERDVLEGRSTDWLNSQSPSGKSIEPQQASDVQRQADTSILLGSPSSIGSSIQPIYNFYQEQTPQGCAPLESRAYIPENFGAAPLFDKPPCGSGDCEPRSIPKGTFCGDTYLSNDNMASLLDLTDPNTPDDTSLLSPYQKHDEAVSGNRLTQIMFPSSPRVGRENTPVPCTPVRFGAVSPQLEPNWVPQERAHLASPYSDSCSSGTLEPSPTVQLIARFAAPKPDQSVESLDQCIERYPGKYLDLNKPTIFARVPPPPIVHETQPTPPARTRAYPAHTPEDSLRPTPKQRLATPPQKMSVTRFDPDDQPFWSTLPTPPNSKPKSQVNEVKTSRFRLPGTFLGSSPLGGNSGRTLYKPPARKWTQSRDEELNRKWKVTRVG